MNCRFCGDEAIAVVMLDRGCVCYPDDREQYLCAQHVQRMTPLGSAEVWPLGYIAEIDQAITGAMG